MAQNAKLWQKYRNDAWQYLPSATGGEFVE
jgi:hypothetical protein